jgi:hypothetical protein
MRYAFQRRVVRAEQRELDALGDARTNASATAGRPSEEICAKGGRSGGRRAGPCGAENDYRVRDAAVNLQAKEQACEQAEASAREASAQEAAGGAPQDPGLQAAAAAAAAAAAVARDALGEAKQQQAHTSEGKANGGRRSSKCGTKDDYRVRDAAAILQAKEQAWEQAEASAREASAQEAACGAPQDPGLQAAAAAAAAAAAVARDAHGKAKQQQARTSEGRQTGGRNHQME